MMEHALLLLLRTGIISSLRRKKFSYAQQKNLLLNGDFEKKDSFFMRF